MFIYKKWNVITRKKNGNEIYKVYKGLFLFGIIPLWVSMVRPNAKIKYSRF